MTDTTPAPAGAAGATVHRGLAARAIGVLFSPRETYAGIAERPRALGILAVVILLMAAPQVWFLSSDVGQQALFDRQLQAVEAFGVTLTDQMYRQLEAQLTMAPYTAAGSQVVIVPILTAVVAGILMGIFSTILAGKARFTHVYAVVAHSSLVVALQQVFTAPLNYVRGEISNVTTATSFFPMLEPGGTAAIVLDSLDFFLLWWVVNLAIGLSVLYQRPLRSVMWTVMSVYAVVAVVVIAVRLAF